MAAYDYAETFARQLAQKYARELCSRCAYQKQSWRAVY